MQVRRKRILVNIFFVSASADKDLFRIGLNAKQLDVLMKRAIYGRSNLAEDAFEQHLGSYVVQICKFNGLVSLQV
jgi:hypothetical protein